MSRLALTAVHPGTTARSRDSRKAVRRVGLLATVVLLAQLLLPGLAVAMQFAHARAAAGICSAGTVAQVHGTDAASAQAQAAAWCAVCTLAASSGPAAVGAAIGQPAPASATAASRPLPAAIADPAYLRPDSHAPPLPAA